MAQTSPGMLAAQRWIVFAETLGADATANLDSVREHLDDEGKALNATTREQAKLLAEGQIRRERLRLAGRETHKLAVRKLLWPADEDAPAEVTDG